ncbi:MAG: tetraacyldisaccharide 4'-kinase [Planktomarina sp.]
MRTPKFWHRSPGVCSTLLAPLGWLYARATAQRIKRMSTGFCAPCPVICVGNINAGGTGKTPTTIAIVSRIIERGRTPIVVSRGFGGTMPGPVLVDPNRHTADQVGDEPLLIAAFCKVIVANDRAAGAKLAIEQGADVIVLDDGFQSPAIQHDLSIVVVNARLGFGNGYCIPAGPLREPVPVGLQRADICLSIGPKSAQDHFASTWGPAINIPRVEAKLVPLNTGMPWTGLKVFAFAGIAHPDKFFRTLSQLGADVVGVEPLSDHEPLSSTLLNRLLTKAEALQAQLVCTEKDAARIPGNFLHNILVLPVRLQLQDWTQIDTYLIDLGL